MVLEYLENEKIRAGLVQGLDYGKKKIDEYLKQRYESEVDVLKHRLEGQKNELMNSLKIREAVERNEIDKARAFYNNQAKAQYEKEIDQMNLGAIEKLKALGYGFEEAKDYLKLTRGSKIYDPTMKSKAVKTGKSEKYKVEPYEERSTGGKIELLPTRPIVLPSKPKMELKPTMFNPVKTNLPVSKKAKPKATKKKIKGNKKK